MTAGGQAYESCGAFLRGWACPAANGRGVQTTLEGVYGAGHYAKAFVDNCDRLECPVCWVPAAQRAGDRTQGVLQACRELFDLGRPRHFSFSSPPTGPESWGHRFKACQSEAEWADVEMRYRRKVNRLIERAGIVGAAVVIHPWRCEEKDGGHQRYFEGDKYIEPHAHVVGFGRVVDFEEFREMSRGWLYVNLDSKKQPDGTIRRVRHRNVKATIAYLLSHVGVYGATHRVSYMGLASPRSMVIDKEIVERLPVTCPCSSPVYVYDVDGTGEIDWSTPRGQAIAVHRSRTYRRRDRPPDGAVAVVGVVDQVPVDVCLGCGCRRALCDAGATMCMELVL